jgi:hypothetical protein
MWTIRHVSHRMTTRCSIALWINLLKKVISRSSRNKTSIILAQWTITLHQDHSYSSYSCRRLSLTQGLPHHSFTRTCQVLILTWWLSSPTSKNSMSTSGGQKTPACQSDAATQYFWLVIKSIFWVLCPFDSHIELLIQSKLGDLKIEWLI